MAPILGKFTIPAKVIAAAPSPRHLQSLISNLVLRATAPAIRKFVVEYGNNVCRVYTTTWMERLLVLPNLPSPITVCYVVQLVDRCRKSWGPRYAEMLDHKAQNIYKHAVAAETPIPPPPILHS